MNPHIPEWLQTSVAADTPIELQTKLRFLRDIQKHFPDIDLSLPLEIIEKIIAIKSKGRFYLFWWEDMGECWDDYLPDGYLLYQHLNARTLTPILPRSSEINDSSRVIEDIDTIIEYCKERGISILYTGTWKYNSLPLEDSDNQCSLYVLELKEDTINRLQDAWISVEKSDSLI